jgi:hypothetical protein
MAQTYRDRIRQTSQPTHAAGHTAGPCGQPAECHAMFAVIADGLDDLKSSGIEMRVAVDDLRERSSGQEAQVKNLWHQLRRVEEELAGLPEMISRTLERHEDTCGGRKYADAKLAASTTKPETTQAAMAMVDQTATLLLQRQVDASFSGSSDASRPFAVPLPKLILYFGGGIGAALAGAAYLLIQLGVITIGN